MFSKYSGRNSCALLIVLSASICSADQIVMKNGDRVTGSIVKKDATTLTIKSTHFGTVVLPWDQVESVKADEALTVVLPGDKTVNGTLATSDGKIQIAAGGQTQSVPPADIKVIRNAAEEAAYQRLLRPGWLQLWTISGNIGIAGTQGNAETKTFTTPVTATRITNGDKTTAYFNFISSSATVNGVSAATAKAIRGGLAYNRNITKRIYLNVFNDYEHDQFQNLDLRAVFGGGVGFNAWKTERARLDLIGGADWNHSSFSALNPAPAFTRNSAEAFWGDDFSYKPAKRLTLNQSYRMFNNLSQTGEYRQNFDAGMSTSISKLLTWNVALSDRFLSDPVAGRKKNDFLYSMGLGITFSH